MINRAENVLEANIEERSSATGSKSVKEYLVEQSHTPACGDDDGVCKERKCCHTGQFMVVRKDANIMMPRHARSRRSCAAATATAQIHVSRGTETPRIGIPRSFRTYRRLDSRGATRCRAFETYT